jgi:PTH1 family peptidyl-tRNA hydrolase
MHKDLIRLIVGLGNPGTAYTKTRHNIGFTVLQAFAKARGLSFRSLPGAKGEIAMADSVEKQMILLKPKTYMNSSGTAVKFCVESFHVPLQHLLVVADDIYLPFGRMRLRPEGSAGGHNGLKSIESHLGTQQYTRLRIGVGDRLSGDLSDHVLGVFSQDEQAELPDVIDQAVDVIGLWVDQGFDAAARRASENRRENDKTK